MYMNGRGYFHLNVSANSKEQSIEAVLEAIASGWCIRRPVGVWHTLGAGENMPQPRLPRTDKNGGGKNKAGGEDNGWMEGPKRARQMVNLERMHTMQQQHTLLCDPAACACCGEHFHSAAHSFSSRGSSKGTHATAAALYVSWCVAMSECGRVCDAEHLSDFVVRSGWTRARRRGAAVLVESVCVERYGGVCPVRVRVRCQVSSKEGSDAYSMTLAEAAEKESATLACNDVCEEALFLLAAIGASTVVLSRLARPHGGGKENASRRTGP